MTPPTSQVLLGRWQDVLQDVECDALIADPPYGERTHSGHDQAVTEWHSKDGADRRALSYNSWGGYEVHELVRKWSPRVRGWMAIMSCHNLMPSYQVAFENAGWYSFAPVPCVIRAMTVRMAGDGPSSWAVYLNVARRRTKEAASWGTLPGAYVTTRGSGGHIGGKPLRLMEAIVRDYSKPGDLICDPCAGFATTGVAAESLGRRFIGAEVDPETHAKAVERLSGGVQMDMFGEAP